MQTISFEEAIKNFDGLCQQTCVNHDYSVINRSDNNHVVLMSLADFNAWQETHYLLSNPNNAAHLLKSLASARAGQLIEKELIES
jgi:antitoxin YefM